MKVIKDLVDSDQFIVQFIVGGRVGQKGVSIRDKQVEHLHDLQGKCHKLTQVLPNTLAHSSLTACQSDQSGEAHEVFII